MAANKKTDGGHGAGVPANTDTQAKKRRRMAHNDAQKLSADERRAEAYRLRKTGLSYAKIGERLGVSKQAVCDYLKEARAEMRAEMSGAIKDLAQAKLDALELIHDVKQRHYSLLDSDDPRTAKAAADVLLKASDQESKLLGLFAPTKIEAAGEGGGPIQAQTTKVNLALLTKVEAQEFLRLFKKAGGEPIQTDYSRLTDGELAQLQALVGKATKEAEMTA
jgi:predicted transcriptional regulator